MDENRARTILAANLRRLIEHDLKPGERFSVRAWALGKELDVRLIDRLTKGKHAVTLDKLGEIAAACGLEPWHLLYDGLEPSDLPEKPVSDADRELLRRLRRLIDDQP